MFDLSPWCFTAERAAVISPPLLITHFLFFFEGVFFPMAALLPLPHAPRVYMSSPSTKWIPLLCIPLPLTQSAVCCSGLAGCAGGMR